MDYEACCSIEQRVKTWMDMDGCPATSGVLATPSLPSFCLSLSLASSFAYSLLRLFLLSSFFLFFYLSSVHPADFYCALPLLRGTRVVYCHSESTSILQTTATPPTNNNPATLSCLIPRDEAVAVRL